ncbi:MAG: YpoC family protein [Bacillota bacterium]
MQDSNRDEYQVPESFLYSPFYAKGTMFKRHNHDLDFEDIVRKEPFYFDMLYLLNVELTEVPWENSERSVPFVIEQWKELKSQLYGGFTQRKTNKQNESALIYSLSLFIICLFWTNEAPVKSLHVKDMILFDLKRKPVNCEERLLFVINKPTQYHSFIQLQQLFEELEKIYYKAQAVMRSLK